MITIEVESMRQAMTRAFSKQLIDMDKMFQSAVEDATQPEKVQRIITDAANRFIKEAVEDETKNFLLYGEGRKLIKKKVKELLENSDL